MLEVLYHPLCPYSRVVRVALSEKNLSFKLQEEKYWQRRDEFLAINPEGNLPVLLTDNGKTICGAYAITEFLEENYDARGLIGRQPLQRAETRRLISWFGNKFYAEVTKNLTWEKYFKKLEERGYPDSKALSAGRSNIFYHLDYIAYLTQNRRFLNSDEFTLADIFAACQLSVLDYFGDVPWEHNPHTKAWYQQIKNRPSFRPLLEDRVAGSNPVKWYAEVA
jgi:glutathione S-transferase